MFKFVGMARIYHILIIMIVIFHGPPLIYARLLDRVASGFQYSNGGLGALSRSIVVQGISRQMRGEDPGSIQESLHQAIVTLAVLDVGGGILAPIAGTLIKIITTDSAFTETVNALRQLGDPILNQVNNLRNLDDQGLRNLLRTKKARAIRIFSRSVNGLPPAHHALSHIRRAKKWLRVSSIGKVIGPIFDVVSIGVNSWALHTAITNCVNDGEACNYQSITSSSLSIAAGLVGVGTFVGCLVVGSSAAAVLGPVGAIIGATLAITATLLELFWNPGPNQVTLDRLMREHLMRELTKIAKVQLFNANKYLTDNNIERDDVYVVNQGHLPKWFSQHPNVVTFGRINANKPRMHRVDLHRCSAPVFRSIPMTAMTWRLANQAYQCPYVLDGVQLEETHRNQPLGYGFYGFTKSARTYVRIDRRSLAPDAPYGGSIVLVGTDQVQPDKLAQYENMGANLKGLYLDTATKSGTADGNFSDLIAIGDMQSLDSGETVIVRMGYGNDALNIDGQLGSFSAMNVLDADLGESGHNTLSFHGMAADSPIQGIVFDAKYGVLHFKHGSNQRQRVGTVRNVEILSASPFNDCIKIYASRPGDAGFDFTVFKFKGHGTYEINIADLERQTEVRRFKVVDNTDNGVDCSNHVPLLRIINFGMDAVVNDVLHSNHAIKIYGRRSRRQRSHLNKTFTSVNESYKRSVQCSGEPADGSHPRGGRNGKVLLATFAFHSKCPVQIETTNVEGTCMMSRRMKSELDVSFFGGRKLFADFSRDVTDTVGIPGDDRCYLICPSARVDTRRRIDLGRGRRDAIVVSNELFFEPCGIDGVSGFMDLMQANPRRTMFKIYGSPKFDEQITHMLFSAKWVLNEFGDVVIDLAEARPSGYAVYAEYVRVTMTKIGEKLGRETSDEIKNNLLQCMKNSEDMSPEERQICEED